MNLEIWKILGQFYRFLKIFSGARSPSQLTPTVKSFCFFTLVGTSLSRGQVTWKLEICPVEIFQNKPGLSVSCVHTYVYICLDVRTCASQICMMKFQCFISHPDWPIHVQFFSLISIYLIIIIPIH